MEKRVKTDRIVLRVGEIEKRTIQGMADKAGLSLTDFILGLEEFRKARIFLALPEPTREMRKGILAMFSARTDTAT